VCDQSTSAGMCKQDYKSLCVAAISVPPCHHRQTDRQLCYISSASWAKNWPQIAGRQSSLV